MSFKKGIKSFSLTGRLRLTDNTFTIDKQKEGSNYVYSSANLSLDCGHGNVFCNLIGGHFVSGKNVLYAVGTEEVNGRKRTEYSKQIVVPYEDRFNEDILKDISPESLTIIAVENDTNNKLISKSFLSKEDAVKYLQATLTDGMVLNVLGEIVFRVDNNGETLFNFNIKRIYLNTHENPILKANFTMSVITEKDGYDSTRPIDENGFVEMDCFVAEYMKEYKGNTKSVVPLPFRFYIDTKANENWKKIIGEFFRPADKYLAETTIEGSIMSVGNTQTVGIEDVPDDIKKLVELGIISKDELASVGANNNSLVQMLVFNRPRIAIQDGKMSVMCNKEKYSHNELEEVNSKSENTDAKPEKKIEEPKIDDDLIKELFG